MTIDEAREFAKTMSYETAVYNAFQGKSIPFRKATKMKLLELLEIAKTIDEREQKQKQLVQTSMNEYIYI